MKVKTYIAFNKKYQHKNTALERSVLNNLGLGWGEGDLS